MLSRRSLMTTAAAMPALALPAAALLDLDEESAYTQALHGWYQAFVADRRHQDTYPGDSASRAEIQAYEAEDGRLCLARNEAFVAVMAAPADNLDELCGKVALLKHERIAGNLVVDCDELEPIFADIQRLDRLERLGLEARS